MNCATADLAGSRRRKRLALIGLLLAGTVISRAQAEVVTPPAGSAVPVAAPPTAGSKPATIEASGIALSEVTPPPDDQLTELMETAVATHPAVNAARATARAAGYDLKSAKWQRFPSMALELQAAVKQRSGLPYNGLYPTVNVEQPLWTGGRITNGIRQASAARDAAGAAYEAAALQIALDVVETYHEVARLRLRQSLLEASRARYREMTETMERRVKAEVSPLMDLELVRGRAAQIEQQITANLAQVQTAEQRLRELTGREDVTVRAQPCISPAWPTFEADATTQDALEYSPRLRQLRNEAAAATAEAGLAKAAALPQISAQYSYNDLQGGRAGLVLRFQTGSGLSRISGINAARERAEASDFQVAAGERELDTRVFAEQAQYAAATLRLPNSEFAALTAKRVHESYLRQFVAGKRSWLDVMNSFQETISADLAVIDTASGAIATMDRLMLLTGRWRLSAKDKQ